MPPLRLVFRHLGRFVSDQALYWVRTGSWWVPAAIIVLAVAIAVAATAQVVVPHTVYVLF